jgi:hypothetical protein
MDTGDIMSDLAWTGQPKILAQAEILCSIYVNAHSKTVEVRRMMPDGEFYVTIGNLFHSQTVMANGPMHVFKIIDMLSKWNGKQAFKTPPGVVLLENDDGPDVHVGDTSTMPNGEHQRRDTPSSDGTPPSVG